MGQYGDAAEAVGPAVDKLPGDLGGDLVGPGVGDAVDVAGGVPVVAVRSAMTSRAAV